MTKTKSTNLTEEFILVGGNHSRSEEGKVVKYRAGDIVPVTPEELKSFPKKFMLLSDFEKKLDELEHRRAEEEGKFKKAVSRKEKKDKNRDPEAIERGANLLSMRQVDKRITL